MFVVKDRDRRAAAHRSWTARARRATPSLEGSKKATSWYLPGEVELQMR